ncbi:NEL-type E3 ubiquitin ligase domain-containing protein [Pseudomonas izuensis]|uniref:NEL-type E3 ubiquitin ligase domain-containing protein n=1 Tax=Pseudomonas izuensis TaxID=2684212 RepID=UPI001358F198|nr:NEL-type E3 ubiquitin ligase domain-containing protein [Pseudomonas izuensis]
MQPTTPKAAPAAVPMTPAQRLEALLERTGDLDKAQVLQASIPEWLAKADLSVVQALKAAFEQSFLAQTKARAALEKLKPLDEFCKEQLTVFLKGKWAVDLDVGRDTLEGPKKEYSSTGLFPIGYLNNADTLSRSLLHAAMENFTSGEAEIGGMAAGSLIRIDAKAQSGTVITPENFATLCRELDLGTRYQRHIDEALALPVKPVRGMPVDDRASAADIRRLKVLDMQVALHMAYLKKDITQAAYTMLLSVVEQDAPAGQTRDALFDGGPVVWQGLMIHDACICGVLVFTKVSIDTAPKARCVVYMPNEPRRPLYEYASLDEFKVYLTLHLQSKSYRKSFVEQYLHGHDKTGFFTSFDKGKTLGTLKAAPADTCIGDFFFSAFISTTQADARILAVPTEDVDEQLREKTIQLLLDGGLMLLNAASFFVPVIGQLMLAAAVVDIVSEVYEGVVDWTHGERTEALSHLLNVVENVAQLAAFVAGGKIIATAISKGVKEQEAFFDGLEAITHDGKARLWKPDLKPYQQIRTLPANVQPDSQGLLQHAGQTSIVMDGATFQVTRKTAGSAWTLNHPVRTDAYQPAVERNVEGGWRHVHEHAHEWRDGAYALGRTDPRLNDLGTDLEAIADITDMTPDKLHQLHESHLKLPQWLNDSVERFKIDRRISALVEAMDRGETANTDFIQEQLHTLPRLPGWPAERFIKVLDGEEAIIARYPEAAPTDDEINSVHVSQVQLDSGKLLDTVIPGLYPKEVEAMIGVSTTESKSLLLARKIASHLKSNRQPLFEWLYKSWDGTATGEVATLGEHAADLPVRVRQELLENASGRDRSFLRDRKTLGMELARQVDEAQAVLRQDRAITGLHLPQLANPDTDNLTLGLMDRVQGWGDGCRLEVRQGSMTGTLLDSVGDAGAQSRAVIIKTSSGFQVTQINGSVSSTLKSETLLQSILDALPATQRTGMGFTGNDALDVPTLRSRLSRAATGDPVHTARLLRGERSETPKHLSACVQANPPAASSYSLGLVRKVRKLYPLFTDAQVSSFLDNAGSTQLARVNRIKELGQQLKKLLGVLHAWRDDEAQMKTLPGQLDDIRVNRRQVANAIENCWRRVARQNQPSTALTVDRSPVGPLPTLTEQDVAHVRSLSIKDMQAGDELAYFLRPFKGLVTLELDRNRLTRLPEALSQMPNLEHLSLDGNQIKLTEHTLRKLADLRNLRTLGLSGNQLGATIDVSKMLDLQSLFLSNTHATELPVGLSRPPYLDMVDLRGNQIRELPDWLLRAPQRFTRAINLRFNPISAASRTRLENYRDNTGIGMGVLDDRAEVLSEQRARDLWMPKTVEETYASCNRAWLALKNEPDSNGFLELLSELGSSADSRFVHEDMTRRVWSVIEATQIDSALRAQLLSMAVKANCADSAATIFSNLEVAVDIDRVVRQSGNAHDQAARLLSLGRRLFRLDYLARLAREHALANQALDPVEVELAYRTGLADRLELVGQPLHMRYASLSGVKPNDLDTAYNKVLAAETPAELSTYISGRTFWSDFLRQHHGKQFNDLTAPFHVRMETAAENDPTFGVDYLTEVGSIAAEQNRAEDALLKRLTEAAMTADQSKACFALD